MWKNDPCFICAHTLIHSILLLIHPIPNFQSPKPLIFPLIPEPYPFARCLPIPRHVGERPERNPHRRILEQSAVEDERGGKAAGARIFSREMRRKTACFLGDFLSQNTFSPLCLFFSSSVSSAKRHIVRSPGQLSR